MRRTNEAVLDDVNASDAVLLAKVVEIQKQLERIRLDSAVCVVRDLHGVSSLELEGDLIRSGGCAVERISQQSIQRRAIMLSPGNRVVRHEKHVRWWTESRVFQDAGLVGDVEQVLVRGVGLGFGLRDLNLVLLSVLQQILSPLELGQESRVPPRGDGLQMRVQCVGRELKSHLVIAFAGGAVSQRDAAFLMRDLDLGFGDKWTSNGCS